MPDKARVLELVAYVEAGRFIEGLERFYHEDVVMQENCEPPRIGLAASIVRQEQAQAGTGAIHEIKAAAVLIDGDRVCIEWHAEWTFAGTDRVRVEETALQVWVGDRIRSERFFYDPTAVLAAIANLPKHM